MFNPARHPSIPLHGHSHFDEDHQLHNWFDLDYFYDLICIRDVVFLNTLQLVYGYHSESNYEQQRAVYYAECFAAAPTEDDDPEDEFSGSFTITWTPPGITLERPCANASKLDYENMMNSSNETPISVQDNKDRYADLPLSMSLSALASKGRERLITVLLGN